MENATCAQNVLAMVDRGNVITSLVPELRNTNTVVLIDNMDDLRSLLKEGIAVVVAEYNSLQLAEDERLNDLWNLSPETLWILLVEGTPSSFVKELALKSTQLYGYMSSPWKPREVLMLIHRAMEHYCLLADHKKLLQQINTGRISSQSAPHSVQTDKIIKLGKMMAEITHEINTPSGAINAASVNISHHLKLLIESFGELEKQKFSQDDIQRILKIISDMLAILDGNHRRSSGEVRIEQKRIVAMLEAQGIRNSRNIGKQIARMDLGGNLEDLLSLMTTYSLDNILAFFTHCHRIITSARDIKVSIEMLTRMLKALKSYLHPKQEKPGLVSIHNNIETALTILNNKLKHRIQVECRWGDNIPHIPGYASELNHVWINLLHNAIQAIEGKGEILIETFVTGAYLGVKITDTGVGIPTNIRDRVFDIDFTTKPQGEGTGLGLYITQQIIEKHGGTITIVSDSEKTTFEVHLPLSYP